MTKKLNDRLALITGASHGIPATAVSSAEYTSVSLLSIAILCAFLELTLNEILARSLLFIQLT